MADALLAVAAGRGRREQISLSLRWCYLSRVFEIFNGSELIVFYLLNDFNDWGSELIVSCPSSLALFAVGLLCRS